MSKFTRRQLLIFFGASAGTAVLAPTLGDQLFGSNFSVAEAVEPLKFTPVRLPHPLPIYQQQNSYYATGIGQGTNLQASPNTELPSYTVIDDVVVPPEYERYVIISWGDRVFPNKGDYFGYNNDYTGFVPIGRSSNDAYLWVNHEYVSYPFALALGDESLSEFPTSYPSVIGQPLPEDEVGFQGEVLYNQGGSIVRVSREDRSEQFKVNKSEPKNRRLHGLSGLGINSKRSDGYQAITSWGSKSYQKGDQNYLIATGPASTQVFNLSSDGLGNKIIGTAFNCSGGTSPWGTILTAEENFQGTVTEAVKPDGTQTGYTEGNGGSVFGMVGEKYGYIVEIDPANPNFRPRKHTALGRFHWENITLRVEAGNKLVTYMGDDRRGGHTWKFVSSGKVSSPTDKKNSDLLKDGTLYAARYNADGTGQWLPLYLSSNTNPNTPSVIASVEVASLPPQADGTPASATRGGLVSLPKRNGISGQTEDGGQLPVTIERVVNSEGEIVSYSEAEALPGYRNKKLSDFYTSQGAVLVDAFLAANLIGATPTARPEDLEINPRNPREVFIAYTDGAPGSDGYPDSRIFVVSKYSTAINAGQPSGELFKIIEDSADGTGNTFRWERFAKGGEAGSEPGSGFANVDNLAFDSQGNVWGVTDMSTSGHNGFSLTPDGAGEITQLIIEHEVVGPNAPSRDGGNLNVATSDLIGVFGNNWLFYIPTSGPDAGEIVPFAYGPVRCEMTGPTFVGDTLILSVQHPGEDFPFTPQRTINLNLEILNLDGSSVFSQNRSVPRGSNWPSNLQGNLQGPPKPSVIGIRRKRSSGRFV